MNKYELTVVLNVKLEDEERAAAIEKVKGYITRFGGTVTNVDEWGKKRLAYEIQKSHEAYYYFIQFHVVFTHNYTHIFGCGKCYGAISYIRYLQHVSYAGFEREFTVYIGDGTFLCLLVLYGYTNQRLSVFINNQTLNKTLLCVSACRYKKK